MTNNNFSTFTFILPQTDITKYNGILDKEDFDLESVEVERNSIIFERDFKFSNKVFIVRVCTGQCNAYVEAFLVVDGQEVEHWTGETLDGEYPTKEYGSICVRGV